MVKRGDGANIEYKHLTKEIADTMHAHGKVLSVWIDTTVTKECESVWNKI